MELKAPCVVKADGTIKEYPPADGKQFTLKEMQKAVGGLIEVVPSWRGEDTLMFANEEGLIIGLPLNQLSVELTGSPLVGDLLVVPKEMME